MRDNKQKAEHAVQRQETQAIGATELRDRSENTENPKKTETFMVGFGITHFFSETAQAAKPKNSTVDFSHGFGC